jgi:XAP5, circadian clock regulator
VRGKRSQGFCKASGVSVPILLGLQLVKNEPLDITYSYWDGSGHRRKITVRKGDTISDFLRAVRDQVTNVEMIPESDARYPDAAAGSWTRLHTPRLQLCSTCRSAHDESRWAGAACICCVHHASSPTSPSVRVLQLSPDFRELRGVGASDLLYVKEDIILPHSQSFYDLIVNQVPLAATAALRLSCW